MPNVLTIREAVVRAKADGLPVSEYSLRAWMFIQIYAALNFTDFVTQEYPHCTVPASS